MLSHEAFESERSDICRSGPPSDGDDLLGMEIDVIARLSHDTHGEHPLWSGVKVRRHEGSGSLIVGTADARPSATAEAVRDALTAMWSDHLRYGYREAHAVEEQSNAVRLRGVTQIGPGEFWVTVDVRVFHQPT